MNINWVARFKNKAFWVAIVPAVLLLITQVAAIFGITFDFSIFQDKVLALVESVFVVFTIMGIVTDPTTEGFADSARAMTYDKPFVSEDGDN